MNTTPRADAWQALETWLGTFADSIPAEAYHRLVAIQSALTTPPTDARADAVEAAAIKLWHRFADGDELEWEDECYEKEPYREAARGVLALVTPPAAPATSGEGREPFGWWLTDCNGIGRFTRAARPSDLDAYRTMPGFGATPLYDAGAAEDFVCFDCNRPTKRFGVEPCAGCIALGAEQRATPSPSDAADKGAWIHGGPTAFEMIEQQEASAAARAADNGERG